VFRRISAIPTGRYILAAYAFAILSVIINRLGKLIPYGAYQMTAAVEWMVMGLFSLSYVMLWALLVVGPLRPRSSFTRRGDRRSRIANFLLALGGLVMLHVFLAFKIGTSVS
jgi:hypothetical protein